MSMNETEKKNLKKKNVEETNRGKYGLTWLTRHPWYKIKIKKKSKKKRGKKDRS
jgi:hypothetical protein